MLRRILSSMALAVLLAFSFVPRAAGDGPHEAPRLASFSPAAVYAGDEFLIDAEFTGASPPRVWVGSYRVPRARIRLQAHGAASGTRRVWGRIPARVPVGEQFLKIATRKGAAVAAKPILVASCTDDPVVPAGCDGDIPDTGFALSVTGLDSPVTLQSEASAAAFDNGFGTQIDVGNGTESFGLNITVPPKDVHAPSASLLYMKFNDSGGNLWISGSGENVDVVEESATRIALCIDKVLEASTANPGLPDVHVKGFLVFTRP